MGQSVTPSMVNCVGKVPDWTEAKLKALHRALELSFPTADIEQMIAEIDRGYDIRC